MSTPGSPFSGDLGINAFAPPEALEEYLGTEEGAAGFSWIIVIDGAGVHERETMFFISGGWTWADYYERVREFRNRVFGGAQQPSGFGTTILARRASILPESFFGEDGDDY